MDINITATNSHAAIYGVQCRTCGHGCSSNWSGGHLPTLIPNGAVVGTTVDLRRLVSWAPGGHCPVVVDHEDVPWILYQDDEGHDYARTVGCPTDGVPESYGLSELIPGRGVLRVVFNGDRDLLPGGEADR